MKATLILGNGAVFHGQSIGATGDRVCEMVFNTSMTGYQEKKCIRDRSGVVADLGGGVVFQGSPVHQHGTGCLGAGAQQQGRA